MSLRRIGAVVARLRLAVLVRVAAARVRLKPMTAQMSQTALALNTPEGMCASAEAFRSACTFSMIAWARWTLSAATVSRSAAGVVVKKAWQRQVSNNVACPWFFFGFRSDRKGVV